MTKKKKRTGWDAIEYAERAGCTLHKYGDPTEGPRDGLSVDEAREIAAEDPGLVWVETSLATSKRVKDWNPPTDEQIEAMLADPNLPRGYYARDVVLGMQALSGADLKGNARKYGSWYARQRARVVVVARRHGLDVVASYPHGRLVWADVRRARS